MQVTGHARRTTEEVYDVAQPSLKGLAQAVTRAVAEDLVFHQKACGEQLLPSATFYCPSSLDLVISQLTRKQDKGDPVFRDPGQANGAGLITSPQVHAVQLVQEQKCLNEALSPQLRLRARLELEALRVLEWCLLVVDG